MEEALREIEALQVLQAVQQPVGVGGIGSRLELPEPHEPRHVGVDRLAEQILKSPAKSGRNTFGDAGFDPAFGRSIVVVVGRIVRVCRQASTI